MPALAVTFRRAACLAALWGTLLTPAGAQAPANLPNSFLPRQAPTVEALARQAEADPLVRGRYARYLHLPERRVAGYLRANLSPARLPKAARFTMYCARANGLLYPTRLTLPAGAAVFALRGGLPLLTRPEGNPLLPYRIATETRRAPAPPVTLAPASLPTPPQVTVVPVPARETVSPIFTPTPVYPVPPTDAGR